MAEDQKKSEQGSKSTSQATKSEPESAPEQAKDERSRPVPVELGPKADAERDPVKGVEETTVDGKKVGRFVGVDPQYMNYSDPKFAPLKG